VLDDKKAYKVDKNSPDTSFVRFGLWDHAYDASGNIANDIDESKNFIGADTRRFYFRVTDSSATGNFVTVKWKTLLRTKADDDAPASQEVHLIRDPTAPHVFVSRALMLVTDDTDADQPTDTGLAAPLPTGKKNRGESNHRIRRATISGYIKVDYTSASGATTSVELPVFKRTPDERKRLKVRVIRYKNSATDATDAYINAQFDRANKRWNQVGLLVEKGNVTDRNIPVGALDPAKSYPGSANNAEEVIVLNDLIPITPDNTLTVVFVSLSGANAYATIGQRTKVTLGDRYFIFINTTLDLENLTLAHELHHVLFNRFDTNTDRQYFAFNTNPPTAYGLPLPDVRIYRRIHNLHTSDPDNDPGNANIINWMRRRRTSRFPIGNGMGAATATTGNTLVTGFAEQPRARPRPPSRPQAPRKSP
jgi:hypothetical protein